jgi:biotin carboxyl carrier protein
VSPVRLSILSVAVRRVLTVSIDGKERIVEIGDAGAISVDGQPVDVALTQAEPGVWILRRGNEQTVAQVDGRAGKMAVAIRRAGCDTVVVAADVSDARRASIVAPARTAAGGAPITVRSPIPGRLIKLLVKVGDAVAAGQTMVVLEAMKMENDIQAPRAGRVKAVQVKAGETVDSGRALVVLE